MTKAKYDWRKMTTHQRIAFMQFEREFCFERERKPNTKYNYNIRIVGDEK